MSSFVRTNRLLGDSPKDRPGFKEVEKTINGYTPSDMVNASGFIQERTTAESHQRKLSYNDVKKTNIQGGLS